MQAKLQEQISLADAEVILGRLPKRIRTALIERAVEIEYPILSKQLLRWRSQVFWTPRHWALQIASQGVASRSTIDGNCAI